MKNINVLLFDDFTILDAFGPIEVFRCLEKLYAVNLFSMNGGKIKTVPYIGFDTRPVSEIASHDILLVPGGSGTRKLVDDADFIHKLKELADKSEFVLAVCTGSALLAKAGALRYIKATSNKMAFDWVKEQDPEVNWIRKARWVTDGKYYTSSGVSAGIDMALGFVKDKIGAEAANKISTALEYVWNSISENDPFA